KRYIPVQKTKTSLCRDSPLFLNVNTAIRVYMYINMHIREIKTFCKDQRREKEEKDEEEKSECNAKWKPHTLLYTVIEVFKHLSSALESGRDKIHASNPV